MRAYMVAFMRNTINSCYKYGFDPEDIWAEAIEKYRRGKNEK